MLFEWQGILQFISQSGFSFNSAFLFPSLSTAIEWLFLKPLRTQTRDKATDWLIVKIKYKKSTSLQSKIIDVEALSNFHTYLQKKDTTFEDLFL